LSKYDVIVIGGGHAGIEAAHISAKRGLSVLLITLNTDEIGEMSCNPAIGGLAKGHLVKEIDALGGIMGSGIDQTSIQYRQLNTKKGMAVRSSRAQADRYEYVEWMTKKIRDVDNIEIEENNVVEFIADKKKIVGVKCLDGKEFRSKKTILAAGTFLRGKMFIGSEEFSGGRVGSKDEVKLSDNLLKLGLELGRLKTGTPARLDSNTINFDILEKQNGDKTIRPFSFSNTGISYDQIPCYITYTNEKTHEIIRENLTRSPLYTGMITGTGPRYCPSIEDKVVRFSDKTRHQIFLEPESRRTNEIYPNGISTSLPKDAQEAFIKTIEGLENAKILKYGYAVEYDFIKPTQLDHSLKVKKLENLFFAGQINGTSGYEEAAAQGLLAGINASSEILGEEKISLERFDSYISVLVDDLVTKGTEEPYRMFTSRSEHRLLLREDNADQRLSPLAKKLNLLSEKEVASFEKKQVQGAQLTELIGKYKLNPSVKVNDFLENISFSKISKPHTLVEIIKREELSFDKLSKLIEFLGGENELKQLEQSFGKARFSELFQKIQTDIRLEGYIKRENEKVESLIKMSEITIPESLNYEEMIGLRNEIKDKLAEAKPKNIREAGKISGVTPAAIDIILINLRKIKK
jgi:tRNA uridine 5-carboxymethylaminomethyl modification enzyme